MAKRLPQPFVKPSISISDGPAGRTWQQVENQHIAVGDIVPDYGAVTATNTVNREIVALTFLNGTVVHVDRFADSFVFTEGKK